MTSREELQPAIDSQIKLVLEKYQCVRGSIRFQAPALLSMSGVRSDGKPVLVWPPDKKLDYLVSKYVFAVPELGGLIVQADLVANQFVYKLVNKGMMQQEARQEKALQEREKRERKMSFRQVLEGNNEPFGMGLARKVVERLKHRSFGYGHRDYCGMGFEYSGGMYLYGGLWDGVMEERARVFASEEELVEWLAGQSDASMARLEEVDDFYWGNQTVTKARLEEFVAGG
jgi:hypothetical protein